jgi:hypothetical protein
LDVGSLYDNPFQFSLRRRFTGRERRLGPPKPSEGGPVPDHITQLPDLSAVALAKEEPFEGGVFDDGFV